MSGLQSPQFSPAYSTTNSINSNNHHINFWKVGSQSPITSYSTSSSTSSSRSQQYRHHLHSYTKTLWKFSKWPLALLVICGIVAMLIYFLFIETKLTESLSQNQLVLNSLSKQNENDEHLQTISFNIVETSSILQHGGHDVDQTEKNWSLLPPPALQNVSQKIIQQQSQSIEHNNNNNSLTLTNIRDNITGRLSVFLQNPLIESNQHKDDDRTSAGIYLENITNYPTNKYKDASITKPPKRENFSRNTQILEISTPKLFPMVVDDDFDSDSDIVEDLDKKILFPTKETLEFFGFTSGHQNNFGVPIEEDERMLRMLNEQIIRNENKRNHSANYYPTTTDGSAYRTRVSPTLPILHTIDVTTERLKNSTQPQQQLDEGKI